MKGSEKTALLRAEAKKRIDELSERIRQLNQAYYNEDNPLVEDSVYDALQRDLRALEAQWPDLAAEDSPSSLVGGSAQAGFAKVPINVPMLSLDDVFSLEDVTRFVETVQRIEPGAEFVVEEKIDGLSIELIYRNGDLTLAHTRGDGRLFGEDVTANAREIIDLPKRIDGPDYLELRGEVYFPFDRFTSLNQQREAEGELLFKNPRNAAAGTLRQLQPELVRARGLQFFIFNMQEVRGESFETHSETLTYISKLGFPTSPNWQICQNEAEVFQAIENIHQRRLELNYALDGAVVKVNSLSLRERMGQTAKAPRWAVAYKYPPEVASTELLEIRTQVGRTGRITPMAIFRPVELAGTTVQRATLNNIDYIRSLDLRVGDIVDVIKSGEIIPAIIAVHKDRRSESLPEYAMPTLCPVCQGATAYRGADLFCLNAACPAKHARSIEHFASKGAMDIAGLGSSTVVSLIRDFGLREISDLYKLKERRQELIASGQIGREKRVDNLLQAIEESKENDLSALITGLGIPTVGLETAKLLAGHYADIYEMMEASIDELNQLQGIGPIIAANIYTYFHKEEHRALIAELDALGVKLRSTPQTVKGGSLSQLTFVITGSFQEKSRTDLQREIESFGGKVSSSVSAKTDYLLAGDSPGSKLQKAEALQIPVIDLVALRKLEERG